MKRHAKVHFLANRSGSSQRISHTRCTGSLEWVKFFKKADLIHWMTQKRWTSKSKTELNKYKVGKLRDKMKHLILSQASQSNIDHLKEWIEKQEAQKQKSRKNKQLEKKQHKQFILDQGRRYFKLGKQIWIFDGRVVHRKFVFDPIPAQVVVSEKKGEDITVKILKTRPWFEAGGSKVYENQRFKFHFDSLVCRWLREGMTAEVVRSYDKHGKVVYCQMSYTRQYLILPSSAIPSST